MRNPKFHALLDKMAEIHDKKNSDYASDLDPYSNFSFAASFADVHVLKVYLTLIGVKAARLHELLINNKEPKNESINDTLLDFATYATIMSSHLMKEKEEILKKEEKVMYPDSKCVCGHVKIYHTAFGYGSCNFDIVYQKCSCTSFAEEPASILNIPGITDKNPGTNY